MFVNFQEFYGQNIVNQPLLSPTDFCNRFIIKYSKPISLQQYLEKNMHKTSDKRIIHREQLVSKLYTDFCLDKKSANETFFNAYLLPKKSSLADLKKYFVYKDICTFTDTNILKKENDESPIIKPLLEFSEQKQQRKYISVQKNDAGKRILRNVYYKELLKDTLVSTSMPKKKTLLDCWTDVFNNYVLDDRYFSPSVIDHYLRGTPIHYFFQQYQPKASIINPYTIYWLLDFYFPKICPRTNSIYTPVLSWSTYALAFCFSQHWNAYFGTDVMPSVCEKTEQIFNEYNHKNKSIHLFNECSEDLKADNTLSDVDLVMCCPPYYKMEIYQDTQNKQSTEKHTNYKQWLHGYWGQTVDNCYEILAHKGIFSFIIGNYKDYKTRKEVDLIKDCNAVFPPEKWLLIDRIELGNRSSTLRKNSKTRSEYLFVYQKNQMSKISQQYDTESQP